MKRYLTYFSLLSLVVLSPALLAQPAGPGEGGFKGFGQADGSRITQKLNRALEAAGGSLLSAGQEEEIAALLEAQRANRPAPDPENRGNGLMKQYGAAILNGDLDAIEGPEGLAAQMADAMAVRTARQLVARAEIQIALLGILDEDQIGALQTQFGERGLLRLLNSSGRRGGKMSRGRRGGGSGEGPGGFSRERMRVAPRSEVTGP